MSTHDTATGAAKPPTLKRDWRFYSGIAAIGLSIILPLCALLVPMLGLPMTQSALLAGALVAGAPEVLCILAVALLGKDAFRYFVHKIKGVLRSAILDRPASKLRYYVGLAIILLSWIPAYVYAYVPAVMPGGDARITILAVMDLAFVASVFLMGGEFWEKVRRIFVYEGKI